MNVLVVNWRSSSLKFQIIATDIDRIKQDKDDRICRASLPHSSLISSHMVERTHESG